MERRKVSNMFCSVHAIYKLTKQQQDGLRTQFYYLYLFKNAFTNYMWQYINEILDTDEEFRNAIHDLNIAYKFDGVSIDEEDVSSSITDLRKIIKTKVKDQYNILSGKRKSEFKEKLDYIYNWYLPDDVQSSAMDDVIDAFNLYFFTKRCKGVHHVNYQDVLGMYAKANISASGKANSTSTVIKRVGDKLYVKLRDVSNRAYRELFEPYYNQETGKVSRSRMTYRYYWAEIFCDKNDILQKCLLEGNTYELGAKQITRYRKNGTWKYRIHVGVERLSPAVAEITNQHHKIGVNAQTETVAYVRDDGEQEIIELSPNTPRMTQKIIELDRYLDNSRRATNPLMYNEDGTNKSKEQCAEEGLSWVKSNRYIRGANKRADEYRLIREERKRNNLRDAKYIFQQGDEFLLDNNRFTAWKAKQGRMNKNSQAKYSRDNRQDYTKICYDRASASVTTRLQQLSDLKGVKCEKIQYFDITSYNPYTGQNDLFLSLKQRLILFDEQYVGDKFKDRVYNFSNTFGIIQDDKGNKYVVQRDLFGASKMLYLTKRIEKRKSKYGNDTYDHEIWEFDRDGYIEFFENVFYPKHKKYLQELIKARNLGIDLNGSILGE